MRVTAWVSLVLGSGAVVCTTSSITLQFPEGQLTSFLYPQPNCDACSRHIICHETLNVHSYLCSFVSKPKSVPRARFPRVKLIETMIANVTIETIQKVNCLKNQPQKMEIIVSRLTFRALEYMSTKSRLLSRLGSTIRYRFPTLIRCCKWQKTMRYRQRQTEPYDRVQFCTNIMLN